MPKVKTDKLTISLILIVITAISFSQNYLSQNSLAQNDPSSPESIEACDFVQFCSNPVEIIRNSSQSSIITPSDEISETTQTTPEDETQTTPEPSELIPDVTSNISLIMTPDLPDNLVIDDFQNPVDPSLQSSNETVEATADNVNTTNLTTLTENATIITPSSEISSAISDENATIAIQEGPESNLTSNLGNRTNTFGIVPSTNMTAPTTQNLTSEMSAANQTTDLTAANQTTDLTAANQTTDLTAANQTTTTSSQETSQEQSNITNNNLPSTLSNSTTQNQPSPTAFLDPIIDPFKQLFGIK
jgi:hypothetical protein